MKREKKVFYTVKTGMVFCFAMAFLCLPRLLHAEGNAVDASSIENMSYEQLIELALQNNPALKAALEGLPAYDAKIKEVKTAKDWSLTYAASITYNGLVPKSQGFTIPLAPTPLVFPESPIYAHDIYDLKFQIQKPLYTGGRVESLVRQSFIQRKIQEQEVEKTRQMIIYQVKEAYFSVLKTYELLKIANEKVSQLQEHLSTAQKKLKHGVTTKFEVLTAEVRLVQAQQNVSQLDNQLKIVKEALNRALGMELTYEQIDAYVQAVEATRRRHVSVAHSLEELIALAQASRPEVKLVALSQEASNASLQIAKTNDNMNLGFFTETGWKRGNSLPEKFQFSFTAGVSFTYPIYDSGQTRAKIRQSVSSIKQSAQNLDSVKQLVEFEVKQASLDVKTAQEKLDAYSRVVEQAEEAYRLAKVQYDAGTATHLDVLDAEVALIEAKNSVVQAQVDYDLSIAKLEKACGITAFK